MASTPEAYRNPQNTDPSSNLRLYYHYDATTLDGLRLTPEEAHVANGLFAYVLSERCAPVRLFWHDTQKLQDVYTYRHSRRVGELSTLLMLRMGVREQLVPFMIAAFLHDYGKLDEDIQQDLYTPDLTPAAWSRMQEHPERALRYFAVKQMGPDGRGIAAYHHTYKRMGPYGAPIGKIPTELRNPVWEQVVAAADIFEAVTAPRPYRAHIQSAESAVATVAEDAVVEPRIIQALASLVLDPVSNLAQMPPARQAYYLPPLNNLLSASR